MSDTPRTDEALRNARPNLQRERDAMYVLARQLELELAEAKKWSAHWHGESLLPRTCPNCSPPQPHKGEKPWT
jgi:hypothetical protein